jgi:hypothetical protein
MCARSYELRLRAEPDSTMTVEDDSSELHVYFQGDNGLTQTLLISLKQCQQGIYEERVDLFDVGNVNKFDNTCSPFVSSSFSSRMQIIDKIHS